MWLPRLTRARLWIIVTAVAVTLCGVTVHALRTRWARAATGRQEARVRDLIRDEPLACVKVHPHRDGITGLLFSLGVDGPQLRRSDRALQRFNPIDRDTKRLTRTAGQTIDGCRSLPDGVPAELILARAVPVSNPRKLFGPYSAHSRVDVVAMGDVGDIKGIEFYTYGDLDVGIKDDAVVVVRVR